jgi:hypothetical protein
MATHIRHQGARLEVYPPGTPIVWGPAGLSDIQNRNGSSFVRRTRFRSFGHEGLGDALDKAEEDFCKVAKLAGATVVEHQWGILPVKNNNNRYFLGSLAKRNQEHPDLLPDNHILVAEVELIRNTRKIGKQQRQLIRGACTAFIDSTPIGEPYWSEAFPGQFTTTQPPEAPSSRQLVLVDIEPIMDQKVQPAT